jgi:branched-chain amino acid transport system permease protein
MNYALHLVIYLAIYTIVALSLNLVVGYCGLLTIAHAAFFVVGAYTYALATVVLKWSFLPAAALGCALAALLSLTVSLPVRKLKGDFFVLLTLAIQVVVFGILCNWSNVEAEVGTWANLTNGAFGIAGIPRPAVFGLVADGMGGMALLAVVLASLCALCTWLVVFSPWGRLLKCIRDDELAARGLGKRVRPARVEAFAIACGMAALAGALYASYVGYIDPSSALVGESVLMLSMVIVGGLGNFVGPIVGAALLLALPEALRFAHMPEVMAANVRLMIYGFLLVLMMHFRPQGIAGEYRME